MEIIPRIYPTFSISTGSISAPENLKLGEKVSLIADYEVVEVDTQGVRLRFKSIAPRIKGRKYA